MLRIYSVGRGTKSLDRVLTSKEDRKDKYADLKEVHHVPLSVIQLGKIAHAISQARTGTYGIDFLQRRTTPLKYVNAAIHRVTYRE